MEDQPRRGCWNVSGVEAIDSTRVPRPREGMSSKARPSESSSFRRTARRPRAKPHTSGVAIPRRAKNRAAKAAKTSKSTSLILSGVAGKRLTPAQKAFNQRIREIEELRVQIARQQQRLDEYIAVHTRRIRPLEQRLAEQAIQLILQLYPHFTAGGGIKKKALRHRILLRNAILRYFEDVLDHRGLELPPELVTVFESINGASLEEIRQQDFIEMRDAIAEEFKRSGAKVDLSGLDPSLPPEELRARLEELEKISRKCDSERAERTSKPKGRRAIEAEAREREMEELRKKDIGTLYRQLAKMLHPDLEQDPARRSEKESAMKDLTTAYKANDLHALLRLELTWITREGADVEQLSEQKLTVYNQVLQEQVEQLLGDLETVHIDPRYSPLRTIMHPIFGITDFSADDHIQRLGLRIGVNDAWIAGLASENPGPALREILEDADTPF